MFGQGNFLLADYFFSIMPVGTSKAGCNNFMNIKIVYLNKSKY